MTQVELMLPAKGLPPNNVAGNYDSPWYGMDSREAFLERGGHAVYGQGDIAYRCNALGYRCRDLDTQADIRMLSIGCSWVFGVGVAQRHLFHELLAIRLRERLGATVANYNLGQSGNSNDGIARILHLAIPQVRPHLVLVLFTRANRREYLTVDDRRINFSPSAIKRIVGPDPTFREVCAHFSALLSEQDDVINFFRNFKSVQALLRDTPWLYGIIDRAGLSALEPHLDDQRYARIPRAVDQARDYAHPGKLSHENIAAAFWGKFAENGYEEALSRSLRSG
jgi:hypothetical protein